MEPILGIVLAFSQDMKQARLCLLGFLLLHGYRGESLFTGLEMLRHLVFRKLSLTKGANASGYRSTSGLGSQLFPPPTSLMLSY
jgi:hypothetical protein